MLRAIRCKNIRLADGRSVDCHRYMVSVPDVVLTLLKGMEGEPDGRLVVRCPACSDESRFAEILYVDGKLTYRTIGGKTELGQDIEYGELEVRAEVG